MGRKKKPDIVVDDQGRSWNLDDFDLDSHGVQAPLKERLKMLAESGRKPEEVSEDIRERYRKYLERAKRHRSE